MTSPGKATPAYYLIRELARAHRKNPTPAEDHFWQHVRNRKLYGLKFNRQYIIECWISLTERKWFIADFHCHEFKLIIELDGDIHRLQKDHDQIRTELIEVYGYHILRFENEMILQNLEAVDKIIYDFMIQRQSSC